MVSKDLVRCLSWSLMVGWGNLLSQNLPSLSELTKGYGKAFPLHLSILDLVKISF